jgi:hypothetical protein
MTLCALAKEPERRWGIRSLVTRLSTWRMSRHNKEHMEGETQ